MTALLCAPPLLALAWFAAVVALRQGPPVRSGDALTDMYLQALADRNAISLAPTRGELYSLHMLPPELWRQWDVSQGGDPDYWLLCYHLRLIDPTFGELPDKYHRGTPIPMLEHARRNGAADWALLAQLLQLYIERWMTNAARYERQPWPGWDATLAEKIDYRRRLWRIIHQQHAQDYAQLTTELAQAGKDQALAHYALALAALNHGDLAQAHAQIAAGNAAPLSDAGAGPSTDAWRDATRNGQPLAGDDFLTGWLAYMEDTNGTNAAYNGPVTLSMMAELAQDAEDRGDWRALVELQRACFRSGTHAAYYWPALQAFRADSQVFPALERMVVGDAERTKQLDQIRALRKQLRVMLHSVPTAPYPAPNWDWGQQALQSAPALCCGWRYYWLDELRYHSITAMQQQVVLERQTRPLFEQLAKLEP